MVDVGRLERRIIRDTARAIIDFSLIGEGDRILVACSGGKDSYTLLHVLLRLQERAPIDFSLVAVNLDQGQPGYPAQRIEDHFKAVGVPYRMVKRDLWSEVQRLVPEGKTACSVCSRLRRGVLYNVAAEMGCTRIALGHHRDDFVETLLLNQFYVGSLKAMAPRMLADNGRTTVIRPLVYVPEEDIAALVRESGVPVVSCSCPVSGTGELKRERMKRLLTELEREIPFVKRSLLTAMGNVQPRHLLDLELTKRGA